MGKRHAELGAGGPPREAVDSLTASVAERGEERHEIHDAHRVVVVQIGVAGPNASQFLQHLKSEMLLS